MRRSTLLLASVTTLALLSFADAASAYYNPTVGRWVTRDPIGYGDGFNTYQYGHGAPAAHVDPSGKVVKVTCDARSVVKERLGEWGISRYFRDDGFSKDKYSGVPNFAQDGAYSEIAGTMIRSQRVFTIKGDTWQDAVRNWELHMDARLNIIAAAAAVKFGYTSGTPSYNPTMWRETSPGEVEPVGGDYSAAVADMWSRENAGKYAHGCTAATGYVYDKGVADTIGGAAFNNGEGSIAHSNTTSTLDWIPGDWGYVANTKFNGRAGFEGENIIYVGMGKWWGHFGNKGPTYKPLLGEGSWYREVGGWDGGAEVDSGRAYPSVGLEAK